MYLSEMLGPLVSTPCNTCQVFTEGRTEVTIPTEYGLMSIQKYLVREYAVSRLPYKVIVDGGIERYL